MDARGIQQLDAVLQGSRGIFPHHFLQLRLCVKFSLTLCLQIVRVIGVHVIGGEIARLERLCGLDMLHVDHGRLIPVPRSDQRVGKGVGGGPVGEGHQPLLFIADRFVLDSFIPDLGKGGLEGLCILGGGHIFSLVTGKVGVILIGVGHQAVLPFYANDVSQHPLGNIVAIVAGTIPVPAQEKLVAMKDVDDSLAVLDDLGQQALVIHIFMGIDRVVVYPHAVDEPQGLLPRRLPGDVVLVKGVVEVVVEDSIHADSIGAQLLDIAKPPQVGGFIDGKVGGPLSGNAYTHIHPANSKRFVLPVALHVDGVLVGFHEGGHRGVGVEIYIEAQDKIGVPASKAQHDQCAHADDEFFQMPSSFPR